MSTTYCVRYVTAESSYPVTIKFAGDVLSTPGVLDAIMSARNHANQNNARIISEIVDFDGEADIPESIAMIAKVIRQPLPSDPSIGTRIIYTIFRVYDGSLASPEDQGAPQFNV